MANKPPKASDTERPVAIHAEEAPEETSPEALEELARKREEQAIADADESAEQIAEDGHNEALDKKRPTGVDVDEDRPRDFRVKAIRMGFYDNAQRPEGSVFLIYKGDFSKHWMVASEEKLTVLETSYGIPVPPEAIDPQGQDVGQKGRHADQSRPSQLPMEGELELPEGHEEAAAAKLGGTTGVEKAGGKISKKSKKE